MKTFAFERSDSINDALRAAGATPGTKFIAGGTNLLDLMKLEVEVPTHLIDINRLGLDKSRLLPTAACTSARWCAMPSLPPTRAFEKIMRC